MEELGYSFSLTTFSPTGQLWQIQHAIQATNRSRLSISIATPNGSVLLVQRKTDELSEKILCQSDLKLIHKISDNILLAPAGLSGDSRSVVSVARATAIKFTSVYGVEPTAFEVVVQVAKVFQEKTRAGGVRPFGVSCVVADANELWQINPSGSYFQVKKWANGAESEAARAKLEKIDAQSVGDGIVAGLSVMREVCQVELNLGDFHVFVIQADGIKRVGEDEMRGYWMGVE